ncbi:DUF4129 domain-containing protein [Pseudoduganella sp. LjRoot289]|uniref:DUF4129 domain-containing protein n=1 Tax=Pseudoduganella sp. LjRoot289 TaxID=3342314 RepID=UPI003ED123B5
MRIDKLQIALRPRPAPQALDLGFALLHAHAGAVYKTWLALWLPAVALTFALMLLLPAYDLLWMMLAWWLRPLLERGPLYVLSRQVFGEAVTWRQAVRAWPGQLGGGTVRLLTWWRLFMPGRGLYQPIWQLEQVRGKAAAERRLAIGRNGTGAAAYRFGMACVHFELILQFGLIALVGLFLSDGPSVQPLAYIVNAPPAAREALELVYMGTYALGAAVIGPVYTACCFTLYLNRRATLEAWDIELTLRQIEAPAARRNAQAGRASAPMLAVLAVLAALACGFGSALAQAPAASATACTPPNGMHSPVGKHAPAHDAKQEALRSELRQLYDTDDLRGYKCEETWHLKDFDRPPEEKPLKMPDLGWLALAVKIALIAGAVALVGWLLYRHRGKFAWLLPKPRVTPATEIAGLDIRAESLPADVPAAVRALWDRDERRNALALLYRATLSRLVTLDGLQLAQGATEGDCLRMARQAGLPQARDKAVDTVTTLWLNGAYGGRWPDSAAVHAACDAWRAQFEAPPGRALEPQPAGQAGAPSFPPPGKAA